MVKHVISLASRRSAAVEAETGWDPHEVWYTRVWLPRSLAERASRGTVRSSDDGRADEGAAVAAPGRSVSAGVPFVATIDVQTR